MRAQRCRRARLDVMLGGSIGRRPITPSRRNSIQDKPVNLEGNAHQAELDESAGCGYTSVKGTDGQVSELGGLRGPPNALIDAEGGRRARCKTAP